MTLEIPDRVLEHTHWTAQELLVEFAVWLYEGRADVVGAGGGGSGVGPDFVSENAGWT